MPVGDTTGTSSNPSRDTSWDFASRHLRCLTALRRPVCWLVSYLYCPELVGTACVSPAL